MRQALCMADIGRVLWHIPISVDLHVSQTHTGSSTDTIRTQNSVKRGANRSRRRRHLSRHHPSSRRQLSIIMS
jgi:hypothetical protein